MQIKRGGGGFTLAELLIVMAIIVVLAAVAIPTFGRQLETSRETADLQVIRSAYEDALALAVLDASDGTIDGKNGENGANFTTYTATANAGMSYAATGKYTVTFANTTPKTSISQTGTAWQYVNATIQGMAIPSVKTAGETVKTATGITFEFEIGTDGNVGIKANGITAEGMS